MCFLGIVINVTIIATIITNSSSRTTAATISCQGVGGWIPVSLGMHEVTGSCNFSHVLIQNQNPDRVLPTANLAPATMHSLSDLKSSTFSCYAHLICPSLIRPAGGGRHRSRSASEIWLHWALNPLPRDFGWIERDSWPSPLFLVLHSWYIVEFNT